MYTRYSDSIARLTLLVLCIFTLSSGLAASSTEFPAGNGWLYNDDFGWVYLLPGESSEGKWFWCHETGEWFYSSQSLYPVTYRLQSGQWLFHYLGSGYWFWDYDSESIISLSATSDRPNVLFVLTDDQGYGDLSLHGNRYMDTPNMDRLGIEGVQLDRFYVHPVCAPTRASLLTGRYHIRAGVRSNTSRLEVINPNEVTIAEVFKLNGYATGCFGKWHSGAFYPENPNGQGFDEYLGCVDSILLDYFDPELHHNDHVEKYEGYITDVLTDAAIDFISSSQEAGKPFFCYVPYNAPHMPVLAPDDLLQKYRSKRLDSQLAGIYGMIDSIDFNLGRLLDVLSERGLEDDTIVIFMTDNGPNTDRYNAGMQGRKGSFAEGGMRVPCFIRWPGKLDSEVIVRRRLAHIDILPTIADLCDLSNWTDLPLDGVSFKQLLQDPDSEWEDRYLYGFNWGPNDALLSKGSIRNDRYLGLLNKSSWSLYDLIADPGQNTNLAQGMPLVLDEMKQAFEKMVDEVRIPWQPTPIPIGHEGWDVVVVESHDSMLKGNGIDNSYGYGNNFIKDWTSTSAYPEWPVEVVRSGTYQVSVSYALKEGCEGVKLRLEIGDSMLDFELNEAHYPPNNEVPYVVPSEFDTYASKPWKKINIGNMSLFSETTSMRLRMIHQPGSEGIELKEIEFMRMN